VPRALGLALSSTLLLWGLLFGSIGIGFFIYGKRQRRVVPLLCGLALMIFPYFVSGTILVVVIGIVLIAIPYFVRL
jgi:predicted membrane protein